MKTENGQPQAWIPCQGEVGFLVRNLRHRRRSAAMQRGIAFAFVMLFGLSTSFFHVVVMADIGLHSGDLTCDQVMYSFHQFLTGKLEKEPELKFRRHLDHCDACRQRRDEHLQMRQYRLPSEAVAQDQRPVKAVRPRAISGSQALPQAVHRD